MVVPFRNANSRDRGAWSVSGIFVRFELRRWLDGGARRPDPVVLRRR